MKMRVFERMLGYPLVEIIPQNANFEAWQATVEVRFFDNDSDGRKIYKPYIAPNVSFRHTSPEMANEWGNIFRAAAMIALVDAAAMFAAPGCDDEILQAWRMVEEARTKLTAAAQRGGEREIEA